MYASTSPNYNQLRQYLDKIPVIETHEHFIKHKDIENTLDFILDNYYKSDFISAGGDEEIPKNLPPKERYERFLKTYRKSDKTAYARGMQEALRICWDIESLDTYDDYLALEAKLKTRDASFYDKTMQQLGIVAKICDVFTDLEQYVDGTETGQSKYCRFAFSLPFFHDLHSKNDIMPLQKYLDRPITCLDDYTEAFEEYFKRCVDFGIVCIKDQSAYRRTIAYENPTKAEAEKAFNKIIFNPRDIFGDDLVRPLDDWLFQYAMRTAARYDLPVQLHTGHMAGVRNEIAKTNAAHLIPTIELHQNVRFDLFHGNWPYMDEYLFMAKNHANVWLNLCWAHAIDPVYCVELLKRAIMTVPHSKLFAFGGDTMAIEWVAGYLAQAKDNVAHALSDLIDSGWLNHDEAKQVALDWFFNNPNEFYKLGL
jgi:predicted TIM-barrel fold metal-dependent hydrolase